MNVLLFRSVSEKTKDALKEEGWSIGMIYCSIGMIFFLSMILLGGLDVLPARWWTATQRVIFPRGPVEVSCQVKQFTCILQC